MKTTMMKFFILLVASLLPLAGCNGGGGSPPPKGGASLEALANLNGGTTTAFSMAVDVNNNGQVIGYAETAAGSEFKAALWTVNADGTAASAPTPLKPIDANTFSTAFGIDEAGNAVGQSSSGPSRVAVLWKIGVAEPVVLPALPNAAGNSNAFGISPDGKLVVGEATDASAIKRAVLWRADVSGAFTTAPQTLPVNIFASGDNLSTFSSASGINNAGWVVGIAEDGDGISHAALWRPNTTTGIYAATDLRSGSETGSIAYAISPTGQIVGESEVSDGIFVPVLWTEQTTNVFTRTSLAAAGSASAINAANRAAGWTGASPRATIWALPAGTTVTLSTAASQVYGINDNNLVVGVNGGKGFVLKVD